MGAVRQSVVFVIGRCAFLAFKCLVLLGWIFGPLIYSPILWLYGVRWWIAILLGIALGCLPMVLLRMLARSGERMDAQRAASELIADYVQDRDLNPYEFGTGCCGNEKLGPFRCPHCRAIMVCCGECDALYPELHPPTASNISVAEAGGFPCPHCHQQIHPSWDDPAFRVPFSVWLEAGLGNLLIHKSVAERVAGLAPPKVPNSGR